MFRVEIQFKPECNYGNDWMLFDTLESFNEAAWLQSKLETGQAKNHLSSIRITEVVVQNKGGID
jgi:hypothetical protein